MTHAIVAGSLSAVSQAEGKSIAESFINADAVIICDVSGSMHATDSRNGQSRFDVACQELARLQHDMPGKLAVISFSDSCEFCPSGQPYFVGSGTNLAGALKFARVADVPDMQFIIISDGVPNSPAEALKEARLFKAPISTIYVGPEGDLEGGRAFLARLAAASHGQAIKAERVLELAEKMKPLLRAGK